MSLTGRLQADKPCACVNAIHGTPVHLDGEVTRELEEHSWRSLTGLPPGQQPHSVIPIRLVVGADAPRLGILH